MIVNDDSSIVSKCEASLTDDARVIIYDRKMFIVEATDLKKWMDILTLLKSILVRGTSGA
jgi:hypothetical protein